MCTEAEKQSQIQPTPLIFSPRRLSTPQTLAEEKHPIVWGKRTSRHFILCLERQLETSHPDSRGLRLFPAAPWLVFSSWANCPVSSAPKFPQLQKRDNSCYLSLVVFWKLNRAKVSKVLGGNCWRQIYLKLEVGFYLFLLLVCFWPELGINVENLN